MIGVSLSSAKRYAKMAREGRTLTPRKAPGKRSKIDEHGGRLLQADLKERPAATLPERCKFLERILRVKVSESAICRLLKRLGWSRKKRSVGASERDEWLRAAWQAMICTLDAKRLVFVDECGTHTSLAPSTPGHLEVSGPTRRYRAPAARTPPCSRV
jgi:transposase